MGYTLEQLKAMGATPVQTGATSSVPTAPKKKYTYDELVKLGAQPQQEAPQPEPAPAEPSLGQKLAGRVAQAGTGVVQSVADVATGKTDAVQGMNRVPLRIAGAVAGGANDIISAALKPLFDKVVDKISDNKAVQKVAGLPKPEPEVNQSMMPPNQSVVPEKGLIERGVDTWKKFETSDPRSAQDVKDVGNIASFAPFGKATSMAVKPVAKPVVTAVKGALPTPPPPGKKVADTVGRVLQGDPEDQAIGQRVISQLDTSKIKKYIDFTKQSDDRVKQLSKAQDDLLDTDQTTRKLADLKYTQKVGDTNVEHNYVKDGLEQLANYYKKTNNPAKLAEIVAIATKANREGLTIKEVNNIARVHSRELNAFNANGELASGLTKIAAENTRMGLKNTARSLFDDPLSKQVDEEISDAIRVRELAEDRVNAVNTLEQKIMKNGIGAKLGRLVIDLLDVSSLGLVKGAGRSLLTSRGQGYHTLNALDLEKQLAKNLKFIKKQLDSGASEDDIIKRVEDYISLRGNQPLGGNRPRNSSMDSKMSSRTARKDALTKTKIMTANKSKSQNIPKGLAQPKKSVKKPLSGFSAEVGVTSFRGKAVKTVKETDSYYETARAKGFENNLSKTTDEFGVKLDNVRKVAGSWEGSIEPSFSAKVTGTKKGILAHASANAKKANQDAVIVFIKGKGKGTKYQFKGITNPDASLAKLHKHGISGASVDGNELRVYDVDGTLAKQVQAFGDEVGIMPIATKGDVQLIFKNDYDTYINAGRKRGSGSGGDVRTPLPKPQRKGVDSKKKDSSLEGKTVFRASKHKEGTGQGTFVSTSRSYADSYNRGGGQETTELIIGKLSPSETYKTTSAWRAYLELVPNGEHAAAIKNELSLGGGVKNGLLNYGTRGLPNDIQHAIDKKVFEELKKRGIKIAQYDNPAEMGYDMGFRSSSPDEIQIIDPSVVKNKSQLKADDFERAPDLSPTDRAIETRAFDKIKKSEAKILAEYKKLHGNAVNADDFRPFFKDVGYKGHNAAAVQEPSSYLAKKARSAYLKGHKGKDVLATAGGSGSGKSSSLKGVPALNALRKKAILVYDSNFSTLASANKFIKEVKDSGNRFTGIFTYRDPLDSLVDGVVKRMLTNPKEMGRLVPNKITAKNHIDSFDVLQQLIKDGNVFRIVDNSLGFGKSKEVSLAQLQKKAKYPSVEELTKMFNRKIEELYKNKTPFRGDDGKMHRITKEQYEGLTS